MFGADKGTPGSEDTSLDGKKLSIGIVQARFNASITDALAKKDAAAALKALDASPAKEFTALVADRRGDVLLAQGKRDEARSAYQTAYKSMGERLEYRRLIEAKLTALAAPPAAAASGAAK